MQGQLFARHSRVEDGERARVAVAPQRERVLSGVFAPGAQREQPVEAPLALLGVVDPHVQDGEHVLLGLHRLGDAHGGAQNPQQSLERWAREWTCEERAEEKKS